MDIHLNAETGDLISIEIQPFTIDNGLLCPLCDQLFLTRHAYAMHQLNRFHADFLLM